MAEAIFRHIASGIAGNINSFEVKSAGTCQGMDGYHATVFAEQVMAERDLDITAHRSQTVNNDLTNWADLILTMTAEQKVTVLMDFIDARGKTYLLTAYVGAKGEVSDPVGMGKEVYRECADFLTDLINRLITGINS
jgi:protein-tyrosine-phosphatase